MSKELTEHDTRILEIFRLAPSVESTFECKYVDEAGRMASRLRARIKKSRKWANIKVHKRGRFIKLEKGE